MKISNKILQLLNEQIAIEANASNYYLSLSSWCKVTGYDGASSFFKNQSTEEREHMLKIIQYLNGLKIHAIIPKTEQPPQNIKSLEQICKKSLENEKKVTTSINKIIDTAENEKDYRTSVFLEWFVNEQLEEEDLFESILQKFDVIGRDKLAVYQIDKILDKLKDTT
jgi:ferritin